MDLHQREKPGSAYVYNEVMKANYGAVQAHPGPLEGLWANVAELHFL
jgi:hypothetical protein